MRVVSRRVRLDCHHLGTWPDVPPRMHDVVFCQRCSDYARVRYIYLTRRGVGQKMACGTAGRIRQEIKVIDLCCTKDLDHNGRHYDESIKVSWPNAVNRCHTVSAGAR